MRRRCCLGCSDGWCTFESADDAVTHAESFGRPDLLSQALGMRAFRAFLNGDGVDESGLRRALELEDHRANIPFALRPTVHNAIVRSCTGELDWAHRELTSLRRRCIENGQDGELMLVALHGGLVEIWRGQFAAAALIAEDTMQLAQQLGGDLPLSVALTLRALLGAYLGRVDEVRADVDEARAANLRCGSDRLGELPATALGFLEVSLGNYGAALDAVAPLMSKADAEPNATEIIAASFIPDAVEAMVALDRLESAEKLVSAVLRNGERLQRDWMLAVGGRGRGMLLAARGDTSGAVEAVEQAMVAHDRLAMPFERAAPSNSGARGVPVRIELGARELAAGTATLVRRDDRRKSSVPLDGAARAAAGLLDETSRCCSRRRAPSARSTPTRSPTTRSSGGARRRRRAVPRGLVRHSGVGAGARRGHQRHDPLHRRRGPARPHLPDHRHARRAHRADGRQLNRGTAVPPTSGPNATRREGG